MTKFYPIFDLNYVIPEKAGKDATYSLSFKGYNVDGTPGFTADAAALTEINAEADGFKLVANRKPMQRSCKNECSYDYQDESVQSI